MCRANDKLIVFNYVFNKFIEYHKSQEIKQMPESQVIETFSNTRLMKLLYLLCLESTKVKCEVGESEFNSKNLFDFFKNFRAFPNGPVLLDIYQSFDIIPGFNYIDGKFVGRKENVSIFPEQLNYIKELIDISFDRLIKHIKFEIFASRDKLIELTHKLPIWVQTYIYSPKQSMSIEKEDLIEEYAAYSGILSAYQA